jgi:hypothetical protein
MVLFPLNILIMLGGRAAAVPDIRPGVPDRRGGDVDNAGLIGAHSLIHTVYVKLTRYQRTFRYRDVCRDTALTSARAARAGRPLTATSATCINCAHMRGTMEVVVHSFYRRAGSAHRLHVDLLRVSSAGCPA